MSRVRADREKGKRQTAERAGEGRDKPCRRTPTAVRRPERRPSARLATGGLAQRVRLGRSVLAEARKSRPG
jgi:hypothetical protein